MATQTTPRNDLLASPYKAVGFIGPQLLPVMKVYVQAGNVYPIAYSAATAHAARAAGGTVTADNNTANAVAFSTSEDLSRQAIDKNQILMRGGREKYEVNLAYRGRYAVDWKIERKIRDILMPAGDSPTAINADVYAGLQSAIDALSVYGDVICYGAKQAMNLLRANTEVKARMTNSGVIVAGLDPRSITTTQLAAVFKCAGFYESLISNIWPLDEIGLMVRVDPELSPEAMPQTGRLLRYVFGQDGAGEDQLMECESGYDDSTRREYLDFVSHTQALVFNASFKDHVRLVSGNPTATPTPTP